MRNGGMLTKGLFGNWKGSRQKDTRGITPHPIPLPSGERDGVRGTLVLV